MRTIPPPPSAAHRDRRGATSAGPAPGNPPFAGTPVPAGGYRANPQYRGKYHTVAGPARRSSLISRKKGRWHEVRWKPGFADLPCAFPAAMPEPKLAFLHDAFLKHAPEIAAFLRGRWPREPDIADLVQESFLRLLQYPQPETIRDPRAFLFQTAANLSVDRHRRREVRERHIDPAADLAELAEEGGARPDRYWESREALERFTEILEELPELWRHAFVLFRIEGWSHAEIAAHLGISVRGSERYVMQAMRRISERLDTLGP